MSAPLDWDRDGRDWPQRADSRFVAAGGLTWRVVEAGTGPVLMLLHGTGASAHSWAGLVPALAQHFTVIAPDLPGHGFTRGRAPGGPSLPGMARAVAGLLAALDCAPAMIVGHSAGVAIALQYAASADAKVPIIGFNPALTPFPGLAARLFPALAKLLLVNPFAPRIFARMVRAPGETERFLTRATGSRIGADGLRCYRTLLGNSRHCDGALGMMASWDLAALAALLPEIANPVLLVHSRGDIALPLPAVERAAALLPRGTLAVDDALGHLAHEEDPERAVRHILAYAQEQGVLEHVEIA
jgi:magnesium chelatase accessory protein